MTTKTIKSSCKYHDDCFTCPFTDCIEEQGKGASKLKAQLQAQALFDEGLDITKIAPKLGKSERTIRRYLYGY